jgi:hypothetical protein
MRAARVVAISNLARWVSALFVGLVVVAFTTNASAEVRLCLEVKTDRDDKVGFEKLVRSELGRHPSHRASAEGCESRLAVELFHLGATRYLTVRIDGEIPQRYPVASDPELLARLGDGISKALGNDPAYLSEDPERMSSGERAVRSVLIRGNNSYRLSLFETVARTDTGAAFAPGAAFELFRGADHFAVFARTALAGNPMAIHGSERALRLLGQVDAGVTYEASSRASTSGYAGLGAGLTLLKFEGRVDENDPSSVDRVNALGATLQVRLGVRFLRLYDFDCDAFLIGALPLFATKNPDALLFGEDGTYTPFLQAGVGFGF